jgi:hypothetical protein
MPLTPETVPHLGLKPSTGDGPYLCEAPSFISVA